MAFTALYNYPFSLEEGFFLSRADTGMLAADAAAAVIERAHGDMAGWVTADPLASQVEIATPVFEHIDETLPGLSALRHSLSAIAESADLRLIAAGTHPLGACRHQTPADGRHRQQAMDDFRVLGQRDLSCGLHVHVAVPPYVDRIDLMNRLVRWLPLFLALSTSSPFWNGRPTGLLSYRQALHDEWPCSGVPDFFEDEADYAAFTHRMERAGALRDAGEVWWAIQPVAGHPTLELRIADACTCIDDAVAVAALFRCLVAAAARRPALGRHRSTHTRRIVDENRWRAKRDGTQAQFIAEASSELLSVGQLLDRTLTLIAEEAHDLESEHILQHLIEIVRRGTSAHRQLAIYQQECREGHGEAEALRGVLRWLEAATLEPPAPGAHGRPVESLT